MPDTLYNKVLYDTFTTDNNINPTLSAMIQLLSRSKLIVQLILIIIAVLAGMFASANAQVDQDSQLYTTLKQKDSLLFEVGFKQYELSQFEQLVNEDFEFYHDI